MQKRKLAVFVGSVASVFSLSAVIFSVSCGRIEAKPKAGSKLNSVSNAKLKSSLKSQISSGFFYAQNKLSKSELKGAFEGISNATNFLLETSYIPSSATNGTLVFKARELVGNSDSSGSTIFVASLDTSASELVAQIERSIVLTLNGVLAPQYQNSKLSLTFQVTSETEIIANVLHESKGFSTALQAGTFGGTAAKQSYEVLQYNAENLWDSNAENSEAYDEFSPKSSNWFESDVLTAKGEQIAKAIALAGSPEIVALQEVESANNKSEAFKIIEPALRKQGYRYFALGMQNDNNPVAVTSAIVSKFPIVKNERVDFDADESETAGSEDAKIRSSFRDPQVVTIDVNGSALVVYSSHWKSKRNADEIGSRLRTKVAKLMRADYDARKKLDSETDAIFVGDFNTDYTDAEVVKGLGTTEDENSLVSGNGLYNLWFELPTSTRCSYPHDGYLTCIDNMVLASGLYNNSRNRYVDGSFQVLGHAPGSLAAAQLMNGNGLPIRWQVQRIGKSPKEVEKFVHMKSGFSDHLPLVARFVSAPESGNFSPISLKNPHTQEANAPRARPEPNIDCNGSNFVRLSGKETQAELAANYGRCVSLSADNTVGYGINKAALFTLVVDTKNPNGTRLAIEINHSFGKNKSAYNDFVNTAPGRKSLLKASGKLGIVNGVYGIFVENPSSDMELSGKVESTCATAQQAEVDAGTLSEANFVSNNGKCASFAKAILKKSDLTLMKNLNVGKLTLANGLQVVLRIRESDATKLFSTGSEFEIDGVAQIDVFNSENQLNMVAFGADTGKILSVKTLK